MRGVASRVSPRRRKTAFSTAVSARNMNQAAGIPQSGASAPAAPAEIPVFASPRLASIDAYRGLVMFLMMAEVLQLCRVASALPESGVWKFLCFHQSHAEWIGCSLHDLIQPSFSFLVGVALPFSIAGRTAKGQSFTRLTA